jgi:hypothetical protein
MRRLSLLAATLLLGACSTTNQVAQVNNKDYNDDVYFSEAKAKEEVIIAKTKPEEKTYRTDEELYGSRNNRTNDSYDYYDDSYSSRINRFYHYTPFSSYYSYNFNPWYDYYGYNDWYSPGLSFYIGINPWRYNNLYSYGYPYNSSYWGPISYNNYFPGYGYGGYSGSYYSGIKDPNYRPRPNNRGGENIGGIPGVGTIRTDGQGRIVTSPSRGDIYERNNPPASSGRTTSTTNNNGSSAPRSRPERTQTIERQAPPRVQESPRQSEPRQSSGSSNGGGGGGGSSDDSGSRARPSRVGN